MALNVCARNKLIVTRNYLLDHSLRAMFSSLHFSTLRRYSSSSTRRRRSYFSRLSSFSSLRPLFLLLRTTPSPTRLWFRWTRMMSTATSFFSFSIFGFCRASLLSSPFFLFSSSSFLLSPDRSNPCLGAKTPRGRCLCFSFLLVGGIVVTRV